MTTKGKLIDNEEEIHTIFRIGHNIRFFVLGNVFYYFVKYVSPPLHSSFSELSHFYSKFDLDCFSLAWT